LPPAKTSLLPTIHASGILNTKQQAQGRPVGVALDKRGAQLVADDVGKKVWRVTATNTGTVAQK
jgi:glucose/arabinose dehydrogenase